MNLAEGRDLLVWTRNGKPPLGTPIPSSYAAGRRRLNPVVRDWFRFQQRTKYYKANYICRETWSRSETITNKNI